MIYPLVVTQFIVLVLIESLIQIARSVPSFCLPEGLLNYMLNDRQVFCKAQTFASHATHRYHLPSFITRKTSCKNKQLYKHFPTSKLL